MKAALSKKKLQEIRQDLEDRKSTLVKDARNYIGAIIEVKESLADISDQASADMDQNFMSRIKDRERKLIMKIQSAIDRIDEGSFGYCEVCGEPIGEKRLQARPVTTQCIECKTDMEEQERRMEG